MLKIEYGAEVVANYEHPRNECLDWRVRCWETGHSAGGCLPDCWERQGVVDLAREYFEERRRK